MAAEHKEAMTLALAGMMDIIAKGRAIQAAVIRSAPAEEIEALRQDAHAMLDAYLDHTASAAVHIRQIVEP